MRKSYYNRDRFKADRARLIEIVGNKLSYTGNDSGTYRVSFDDDDLRLYIDVYLSKRTVVVRHDKNKPRYYRNLSWEQLTYIFHNLGEFVWG